MKTEFEKELQELFEAYDLGTDTSFAALHSAFVAKYDPAKQPQSNVTRIAGAMDAQTVEKGLSFFLGGSPHEKPIKTTQFDTLTNPTHIIHPLGFEFEVKDAIEGEVNEFYWLLNGNTHAIYNYKMNFLRFCNPFMGSVLQFFGIENLILDLPK